MCAIVDASVVSEVFGHERSPAGVAFFKWLNSGKTRLVVGGKLRTELYKGSTIFRQWAVEAYRSNILNDVDDVKVDGRAKQLVNDRSCKSDDQHIVALAQVGGARLLYSNDRDLHQDFRDKLLVDNPRGQVYSTLVSKDFTPTHRRLLRRKDLCGVQQ